MKISKSELPKVPAWREIDRRNWQRGRPETDLSRTRTSPGKKKVVLKWKSNQVEERQCWVYLKYEGESSPANREARIWGVKGEKKGHVVGLVGKEGRNVVVVRILKIQFLFHFLFLRKRKGIKRERVKWY